MSIRTLETVRSNQAASKVRSPQAACTGHAALGGREGRNKNRFRLDWKQRGTTPLESMPSDGGREANRLWELSQRKVASRKGNKKE